LMALLLVSATYRLPAESTARPSGPLRPELMSVETVWVEAVH